MKRRTKQQRLATVEQSLVEEETQPLPDLTAQLFPAFLALHELSILDVALAARVRLLTVWKIEHNEPVSLQHAEMVRAGIYRLTGIRYRGPIMLSQSLQAMRRSQ